MNSGGATGGGHVSVTSGRGLDLSARRGTSYPQKPSFKNARNTRGKSEVPSQYDVRVYLSISHKR